MATVSISMNARSCVSTMSTRDVSLIGSVITWVMLWLVLLSNDIEARYVRPEDCTWEPVADAAGVSMTCSVRTIESGTSPTNFSLILPGHTVQLAVICDDLLVPSELANGVFEHLRGLQELSIERCKFNQLQRKAFDGLSDLKRLSLKTFNTEWGRPPLRMSPTAFGSLESIETVDLSENNIDLLPHTLFCGLAHLRFVNLSGNAFYDDSSLGLSSKSHCRPALRELDVTHNKLKVLSAGGLAALGNLEELRLEHNQIVRVEADAFSGLTQLVRLDVSHNSLFALPPRFFRSTQKLAELYMRNNSLSALPFGLFTGLHELTMLDLAHNQLSALGWLEGPQAQADLDRLTVLDLSYNRLGRLDENAFHILHNLQTLQLQNNLIEFIADNAFGGLHNLQTLVLSQNRLKRVGPQMVAGLNTVTTLLLDDNRISGIHDDAFRNISALQELNLAKNELKTIPFIVSSLNMLRTLDLSDNKVNDVANFSYQGLGQLYALNLMGNKIGNLTVGVFNHLPSVRILNLANNEIQAVEQGTFDDMPGLHYLRLDSNLIEDVNGLFSNLHDLIMLNISVNRVRWFDYALIPVGLQWLDIHDNEIETLGNYFDLEQSLKLRTLDASYNKLIDLDSSSLPNGIEIVFLKNNNIKLIQPFTFLGKHNLTRVDLTNNHLEVLEMTTFRLSEVSTRRPLPEFAIAGNPYVCNCQMEWLRGLKNSAADGADIGGDSPRQYPRVIDLHSVECRLPFSKSIQQMPLVKVDSSQFLCPYKTHCFSLCHCCDFDACDCEMVCPTNCSCYHDQTWGTNIVDCSSRNHSYNLDQLPIEVNEVYLDGNNITEISAQSFVGRKKLWVLYLNNSNIATIKNQSLAGLHELLVLRLEDNRIAELYGYEFDDLDKLRELYLSNNRLKYISNITFAQLKGLEILRLDRNDLLEISLSSFQSNARLVDLHLAGNPWTCDCRFTLDFSQFLFNERGNIVRDVFELTCVYNETKTLPLWELNVTDCFGLSEATSLVHSFRHMENLLPMFIIFGLLIIILLIAIAVGIVYRRKLNVWFFSRYGVRMCHRAAVEEEKLFDAFVSYSKKDEAFVAQILAPELECGNPPYRLCLHYRDLSMAGGYLSEAIQEAVESSRRTIVVLSEHFLKSEWCRYEFKSAHHEVLNNSNYKLIVIFLGRVSYRELDSDIRMWLKQSTFLHWGEKNFWDKLRYSLPDARHRKVLRSDLNSVAVHI